MYKLSLYWKSWKLRNQNRIFRFTHEAPLPSAHSPDHSIIGERIEFVYMWVLDRVTKGKTDELLVEFDEETEIFGLHEHTSTDMHRV